MTQARTEAVYNGARWSFIVAALCIGPILLEIVSYNVRGGLGILAFFFGFVPFLVAGIVFAVGAYIYSSSPVRSLSFTYAIPLPHGT